MIKWRWSHSWKNKLNSKRICRMHLRARELCEFLTINYNYQLFLIVGTDSYLKINFWSRILHKNYCCKIVLEIRKKSPGLSLHSLKSTGKDSASFHLMHSSLEGKENLISWSLKIVFIYSLIYVYMCVCACIYVHRICSGVRKTGVKGGCELCCSGAPD